MITYRTGDLFDADTEALVNTVNTVGVMGKGVALQFAERYKSNLERYKEACKSGELVVGKLLVTTDADMFGERIIVNFPTKQHWKHPSDPAYIEAGLVELVRVIKERAIASIALPALGCGNGGLSWAKVKPMIAHHLGDLEAEIVVYQPPADVTLAPRK